MTSRKADPFKFARSVEVINTFQINGTFGRAFSLQQRGVSKQMSMLEAH